MCPQKSSTEHDRYELSDLWLEELYSTTFETARLQACLDLIPADVATLLDAGAGNGAFLRLIEQRKPGLELTGMERSTAAISSSLCETKIKQGSLEYMEFSNSSYDLVVSLNVIEHLPYGSYEKSLAELLRVSSRYVMISVPYKEKRLAANCPNCGCRFNPHYHMRDFDEDALTQLFPDCRVVEMRKVRGSESIIKVLALPFRRTVFSGFPNDTICPQCGYGRKSEKADTTREDGVKLQEHIIKRAIRACVSLFPMMQVPRTIVVLFDKRSTDATSETS